MRAQGRTRQWKQTLGVVMGSLALITGILLNPWAVAHAAPKSRLVVDVAQDLTTFNIAPATAQSGGAFQDGAFYVSGDIYPEGTLLPDGSVPAGAAPIGKWFCSGFINGSLYTSTDVYVRDALGGQIVTSQAGPLEPTSPLIKAVEVR